MQPGLEPLIIFSLFEEMLDRWAPRPSENLENKDIGCYFEGVGIEEDLGCWDECLKQPVWGFWKQWKEFYVKMN